MADLFDYECRGEDCNTAYTLTHSLDKCPTCGEKKLFNLTGFEDKSESTIETLLIEIRDVEKRMQRLEDALSVVVTKDMERH